MARDGRLGSGCSGHRRDDRAGRLRYVATPLGPSILAVDEHMAIITGKVVGGEQPGLDGSVVGVVESSLNER